MAMTKLSNLVNPEVMADSISATLPKKIKFTKIAKVDSTLQGTAGNTITVPKFAYIGEAEDVAEGVEMGTVTLTASTTTATVKKAGKAVELTDEAVLSGYGDPAGEAEAQLKLSIADKVDDDCFTALLGASLVHDGTAAVISYDGVTDASGKFEDEVDDTLKKLIFINPAQVPTIQKDDLFQDKNKYPLDVVMNGTIGSISGCQVIKSKRVPLVKYTSASSGTEVVASGATSGQVNLADVQGYVYDAAAKKMVVSKVGDYVAAVTSPYFLNPIVVVDVQDPNEADSADGSANEAPALTIYMKRNVNVESDRDILKKTTVISVDEHYTAVLSNDSKVVMAKFKA